MLLYFVDECIIYSSTLIFSVLCLSVINSKFPRSKYFAGVDLQKNSSYKICVYSYSTSLHYGLIHKFKYSSSTE
jgi:hypothetical protein